jgi:type IV pilus assembly protein PilO
MALLPQNQRDQAMLFVCIVALGLVYLYYQFLWSGKNDQLAIKQMHVDTLEVYNDSARRDIARGATGRLRQEAEVYRTLLGQMRQLVPTQNEVPALLDQVSTAARKAGLEIGEFTPLPVIPGPVFDTYRYKMSVSGPYHRIGEFLTNVGGLTRIAAPMNVGLGPSPKSGAGHSRQKGEALLEAGFELQTYVAKTAAPSTTSAPTGASSTTTTPKGQ